MTSWDICICTQLVFAFMKDLLAFVMLPTTASATESECFYLRRLITRASTHTTIKYLRGNDKIKEIQASHFYSKGTRYSNVIKHALFVCIQLKRSQIKRESEKRKLLKVMKSFLIFRRNDFDLAKANAIKRLSVFENPFRWRHIATHHIKILLWRCSFMELLKNSFIFPCRRTDTHKKNQHQIHCRLPNTRAMQTKCILFATRTEPLSLYIVRHQQY